MLTIIIIWLLSMTIIAFVIYRESEEYPSHTAVVILLLTSPVILGCVLFMILLEKIFFPEKKERK